MSTETCGRILKSCMPEKISSKENNLNMRFYLHFLGDGLSQIFLRQTSMVAEKAWSSPPIIKDWKQGIIQINLHTHVLV